MTLKENPRIKGKSQSTAGNCESIENLSVDFGCIRGRLFVIIRYEIIRKISERRCCSSRITNERATSSIQLKLIRNNWNSVVKNRSELMAKSIPSGRRLFR